MLHMIRRLWIAPLVLVAFAMIALQPQWQISRIEHAFSDQLLSMGAAAAIQAGYVQTMHEQRWSDTAFVNVLHVSLPRGRTEARLRAPIMVYYGVRPQNLHVTGFDQGLLRIAVDRVEVLSVDTDLAHMEMETRVGWARLDSLSGETVRSAAKERFQETKYRAASRLLMGEDASSHIQAAIREIAMKIPGVTAVEVIRRDTAPESAVQREAARSGPKSPLSS